MTTTNHTIGEDAANGAMGEREALLRKIRITCESRFVKMGDDYALGANQVARDVVRLLDQARAALTAEKVTGQEAVKPIYQQRDQEEHDVWHDTTKRVHDSLIPELRRIVYPAPQQPAQSGEHCVNCGASVDPLCACERGRKLAAQSGEQDERAAFNDWWERRGPEAVHMLWTEDACWFAWQARADALVERYAAPIRSILANAEQATAAQPVQTERALTDEQIRSLKYVIGRLEIASVEPQCEHARNLKALIAAQPASSLAEGGERE